jgi:23S rRNA pseudouridine1911/1915/1917 synthase
MNERVTRYAVVPDRLAGQRLDQAAAAAWPEFSRNRLKAWIESGHLTVEGCDGAPKQRVKGGEAIALDAPLEPVISAAPEAIPLSIVHADAALFIVDKPAGLVVHPGAGNASGTMQNALLDLDPALAAVPRAGIVHRLDKDTSGLLVVARTLSAQAALVEQLERRAVRREYRGICQTVLTGGGTIDAPIGRHARDRTRKAVVVGGREARTRYRVIERFRAHTFVELALDTGRTHQIRVHMAHIRAPLVGDTAYGGRPKLPRQPSEALRVALQTFPRQALHAARLAFLHPVTGAPLEFESELPDDMAALVAALRADAAPAEVRA